MDYTQKVSEYFGTPVNFPLNGEIHRFGIKKELWAVGREWQHNSKPYWQVRYGNFKLDQDGNYQVINSWEGQQLSHGESNKLTEITRLINAKLELDKQEKYRKSMATWSQTFPQLPGNSSVHEYLKNKKLSSNYFAKVAEIPNSELNIYPGTLVIPVFNTDLKTSGVQRIYKSQSGFEKRFSPGLELKGSFCHFAPFTDAPLIYLAEGFATAASIYEALEHKIPTVCCFNAGNIIPVIQTIRQHNPTCKIVIGADRDLESKTGEIKAKQASLKFIDVIYRMPEFPPGSPDNWSDYNDLHNFCDIKLVKKQLKINQKKFKDEQYKHLIQKRFIEEVEVDEKIKKVWQYQKLREFFETKFYYKVMKTSAKVFTWDKSHYSPESDLLLEGFATKYFPDTCQIKNKREFVSAVKTKLDNIIDDTYFNYENIEGLINLNNCVYDFKNNKTHPHSPEYPFLNCIPVGFNPDAQCPTWDQLMVNITLNRPHLVDVIEEFLGFIISNMSYSYFNKALVFDGTGSNGKTTVLNIIKKLLGHNNYSGTSLADAGRFTVSDFANKLVNFGEEEPETVFSSTGKFKKITGGSVMQVEAKNEKAYSMEIRTKIILSYNKQPHLSDSSQGMRRRLIIIPFDLNLEENPAMKIFNINEKLESELPGILNRALNGLHRLIQNGDFTYVPESKEKMDKMINESDSVRMFFNECIKLENDAKIFTKNLYEEFLAYTGGKTKIAPQTFSNKINEILKDNKIKSVENKLLSINNEKRKGFIGIALDFKANFGE